MSEEMAAHLHRQAEDDQWQAALHDYIACDDPWRRWPLLMLIVRRNPRDSDWRYWETMREAIRAA